jgi:hypothetical protein
MGFALEEFLQAFAASHPSVSFSAEEKGYYTRAFAQADGEGSGRIGGSQAVSFLSRTGLEKSVLRDIWDIADDARCGWLGLQEFSVALRLVAHAQAGKAVSEDLVPEEPVALPQIEGLRLARTSVGSENSLPLSEDQESLTLTQLEEGDGGPLSPEDQPGAGLSLWGPLHVPGPLTFGLGSCCCSEDLPTSAGQVQVVVDTLAEQGGQAARIKQEPASQAHFQPDCMQAEPATRAHFLPDCLRAVPWNFFKRYTEFRVTVEKSPSPGLLLGLELDLLDGVNAMVCGIRPGILANYNCEAPPDTQLKTRDWIVEVNGVRNDALAMHKRLKEDNKLDVLVRRTKPFSVKLSQAQKGSLCAGLMHAPHGVSLLVINDGHGITEHGLKKNDRIVEVNGDADLPERMMCTIREASQLKLTILRPVDDLPAAPIADARAVGMGTIEEEASPADGQALRRVTL